MRRLLLGLLLVSGLAACGGRERAPALAPVRLVVTSPADASSVDAHAITVSGTVAPTGARVLVAGREADVVDGRFSAQVDLLAGANVIDVEAAAPQHPAAMTALRVTRLVPVRIPDVSGQAPEDAVAALEALGLETQIDDTGFLDPILPGTVGVCETEPAAGTRVRVGSLVTVRVQKSC